MIVNDDFHFEKDILFYLQIGRKNNTETVTTKRLIYWLIDLSAAYTPMGKYHTPLKPNTICWHTVQQTVIQIHNKLKMYNISTTAAKCCTACCTTCWVTNRRVEFNHKKSKAYNRATSCQQCQNVVQHVV